jgi:hypothetical protein
LFSRELKIGGDWAQGDQKIGGKICLILEKVSKTVALTKVANISTSKLNLKAQNIYIKPLLKPNDTCNKPYFKTAYYK